MEDTPEVKDSLPIVRKRGRPRSTGGSSSSSSPRKSKAASPSQSSVALWRRGKLKSSIVNYGPILGWEPTFQAVFRTPFFKKMTQAIQAEREHERKKYLANVMATRIREELLRHSEMKSLVDGVWT